MLGSRLTRDAVLAYDGALSLYGLAPLGHSISFLTQERVRPFRFNEVVYRPVLTGRALESGEDGLQVLERAGQKLLATTLERTFVDLLDRLDLAPGLVELWRCFAAAGQLDTTAMIRQVRALESRLVAARVGLFLEERRSATPSELHLLRSMGPRSSSYFDRNLRSPEDVYFGQWKLVVPAKLLSAMRYSRAG
ncbi:MAG: type IV toxin-antitoxin system AbiEi family antitoxin domain-containing protein [Myxococcota bacterium]